MEQWIVTKWYHIWGLIVGIGSLVFGAGMVVEKTKTDRFVSKREFDAYKLESRDTFNTKLDAIKDDLVEVKAALGIPARIIQP